jgi:VCBS repeat-containing protein
MDVVIVKKPKNTTRYSHDVSFSENSMNDANVNESESDHFGNWSSSQDKKQTNTAFKDIHEFNESIMTNHHDRENTNISIKIQENNDQSKSEIKTE